MKYLWVSLVALLAFSGLGLSASNEDSYSGEVMDAACAKAGSHTPMMKNMGMKTAKECTLACIKMGDKYVLFDKSNKKIYQLDNQAKFEQFAGQKVTVKGTLDSANGTIHVTDIAPASGAEKPKAAPHSGL